MNGLNGTQTKPNPLGVGISFSRDDSCRSSKANTNTLVKHAFTHTLNTVHLLSAKGQQSYLSFGNCDCLWRSQYQSRERGVGWGRDYVSNNGAASAFHLGTGRGIPTQHQWCNGKAPARNARGVWFNPHSCIRYFSCKYHCLAINVDCLSNYWCHHDHVVRSVTPSSSDFFISLL